MRQTDKSSMTIGTLEAILPLKNKLYRYALRIIGNEMQAEDVVQEVLVKVWKRESEVGELENSEAWCMTVTRNLALDKLRRHKYTDDIDQHLSISTDTMTPEQSVISEDMMKIIHNAIASLPSGQNQVVHLREIEGYSYKEIANITDMSEDQVKVYLHRARITLRNKLAKYYS